MDFPEFCGADYSSAEVTVIFFEKSGSHISGTRLEKRQEVAAEVRRAIKNFQDYTLGHDFLSWSPERADEAGSVFVADAAISHGRPQVRLRDGGEVGLIDALKDASTFPVGDPSKLKAVYMYAFIVSMEGVSDIFLRKVNPKRFLSSTRWFIDFSAPALRVFEADLFAFDDYFDFVIHESQLFIYSARAFELVFRNPEMIKVQVPLLVADLKAVVSLAEQSQPILEEAAIKYVRQRRKLEALLTRGHLAKVEAPTVRERLSMRVGDKLPEFMNDQDELLFTAENSAFMLAFLNEDYFRGELSDEQFEAERKRSSPGDAS